MKKTEKHDKIIRMIKDKELYINGKKMPFTAEELVKVLNIMKKSVNRAAEGLNQSEEIKIIDGLLQELNNI